MTDPARNPLSAQSSPVEMPSTTAGSIVFFDGVCGLCNSSVNFLLTRDTTGRLLFAPLQGPTAAAIVPADDRESLNTLLVHTPLGLLRRTDAVAYILRQLPGLWPIWGWMLACLPRFIRDTGYRWVARNRYRLFGQHETCRLPTSEERARFMP